MCGASIAIVVNDSTGVGAIVYWTGLKDSQRPLESPEGTRRISNLCLQFSGTFLSPIIIGISIGVLLGRNGW